VPPLTERFYGALYAITPPLPSSSSHDEQLLSICEQALIGGAAILQYRDKTASLSDQQRRAEKLSLLCRQYECLFIINDSPALAEQCGADGVHLGLEDGSVASAKTQTNIVGVTCQNSIKRAIDAQQNGADYVALGAVFATQTKSDTVHCPLSVIKEVKAQCDLPVVAVGGITLENILEVKNAGADAAAVCQGLFGVADITETARSLCKVMRE